MALAGGFCYYAIGTLPHNRHPSSNTHTHTSRKAYSPSGTGEHVKPSQKLSIRRCVELCSAFGKTPIGFAARVLVDVQIEDFILQSHRSTEIWFTHRSEGARRGSKRLRLAAQSLSHTHPQPLQITSIKNAWGCVQSAPGVIKHSAVACDLAAWLAHIRSWHRARDRRYHFNHLHWTRLAGESCARGPIALSCARTTRYRRGLEGAVPRKAKKYTGLCLDWKYLFACFQLWLTMSAETEMNVAMWSFLLLMLFLYTVAL